MEKQLFSNPCEHCQGMGGFYTAYDPSPSGVSLSPGYMQDFDLCHKCLEQQICPSCGEYISIDDNCSYDVYVCEYCGWNDADDFEFERVKVFPYVEEYYGE